MGLYAINDTAPDFEAETSNIPRVDIPEPYIHIVPQPGKHAYRTGILARRDRARCLSNVVARPVTGRSHRTPVSTRQRRSNTWSRSATSATTDAKRSGGHIAPDRTIPGRSLSAGLSPDSRDRRGRASLIAAFQPGTSSPAGCVRPS